jgi:hypothetical protein
MLHTQRRLLSGAAGAGLALVALVGLAVATFVLVGRSASTPPRMLYPPDPVNGVIAYDLNDAVPTTYGVFTETAVRLMTAEDGSDVTVALRVDNDRFLPMQAPALDELRMVTTDGVEATYLDGGWGTASVIWPRSSSTGEFHFAAPPAGGMLILEYREPSAQEPIRIAVGYALEHADASTSAADTHQ